MTGEVLTHWQETAAKEYDPAVLLSNPLPAGAGWLDLSEHRRLPSPNVTIIRVSGAPQEWFDALEPGSLIEGPYEDGEAAGAA